MKSMKAVSVKQRVARLVAFALVAVAVALGMVGHAPGVAEARTSRNVMCARMWQTIVTEMRYATAAAEAGDQAEAERWAGFAMDDAAEYAASCMA
jgi:hypothetical protein